MIFGRVMCAATQSAFSYLANRTPRIVIYLKHAYVATSIAAKWEKSYAETCAFARARLLFGLVRASSLCPRGSRVKWRSGLGFDDEASLPTIMQ